VFSADLAARFTAGGGSRFVLIYAPGEPLPPW
jgi:hypothetical protein